MNITATKILRPGLLAALLLLCAATQAQDTPAVGLFTYNGERSIDQMIADPLLFYVIIDNGQATGIERTNQRNREIVDDYSNSEAFAELTRVEQLEFFEEYAIQEIPGFILGSEQTSLEGLISFLVRDDQGNGINLDIRPLATNEHEPRPIDLLEERSLYYQFAVESDQLRTLTPGKYHFVASIDTTQQDDMWRGWTYSRSVAVELGNSHPDQDWDDSEQRLLMQSTFLIEDHQFVMAEDHARKFIQKFPESVNAWAQLGEALFGLGRNDEALDAFNTALARFRAKHGNTPRELPNEILDRVREIKDQQP